MLDSTLDGIKLDHAFAIYGSLRRGADNHHIVANIHGEWVAGYMHGYLYQDGWGAEIGFPGIVPDPDGPRVNVEVLVSRDMPEHWQRLDEFEGEEYARVPIEVHTENGTFMAQIYAIRVKKD